MLLFVNRLRWWRSTPVLPTTWRNRSLSRWWRNTASGLMPASPSTSTISVRGITWRSPVVADSNPHPWASSLYTDTKRSRVNKQLLNFSFSTEDREIYLFLPVDINKKIRVGKMYRYDIGKKDICADLEGGFGVVCH